MRFTPLLMEPHGFFVNIYEFTGISRDTLAFKKEINEIDKWEPSEFFEDLIKEIEIKRHFFSTDEEKLVYSGLKFILHESKTAKIKRDEKGNLKTWRTVRPVLQKYGVFYKYNGANLLSSRLRLFLS